MKGTVRWFSNSRGYGFISPEEGEDVFVHFSAIAMDGYKSLPEGSLVEFEISDGPKGKRATDVKVTGEGAPLEKTDAEGSPSEGSPSEGSPSEGSPSEGSSSEESTAEESPAEESPAEESSEGEESGEDTAEDSGEENKEE